jgi:hypothetical protein
MFYGSPSPESLADAPVPGGMGAWLRGHGVPADVPRVAVAALVAAAAGAAIALIGANLAWWGGRLSDRGLTLLAVDVRGTQQGAAGYVVIGAALAAIAVAAAARTRPSRWWNALVIAALGAGIAVSVLRTRADAGQLRAHLLSIPLFLADTHGVRAHAWLAAGWWVSLAGGVVTTVAGLVCATTLIIHRRRGQPPS